MAASYTHFIVKWDEGIDSVIMTYNNTDYNVQNGIDNALTWSPGDDFKSTIVLTCTLNAGKELDTVTNNHSGDDETSTGTINGNVATIVVEDSEDLSNTITLTSKSVGGGGSMTKQVDLTTLTGWANLSDGEHTITIKAKADGYRDSQASEGVTVTKGEPASQYKLINNSNYIAIRVNGQNVSTPYQLRSGDVIYAYATSEDIMSNIKVNGTTYADGSTTSLSNADITIDDGNPVKTGSGAQPDVTINFSVSTGETWVLNETPSYTTAKTFSGISFVSNGTTYTSIVTSYDSTPMGAERTIGYYGTSNVTVYDGVIGGEGWKSTAYRTITFSTAPTGDLLTWLQANGTKQGGG